MVVPGQGMQGLEERFGTHFTGKISSGDADQINMQEVKKVIGQLDGLSDMKRKLHGTEDD